MPEQEKYYSTREAVELTGLPKDTLRFYEKIGILQPVARDSNHYRKYSQDDIDWILLVKYLRGIGIETTAFIGGQHTSYRERCEYLEQYQVRVQNEIKELQRINDLLSDKIALLRTYW
ncbi:MerR family transcriptional regulator [Paenibacillus glycanilyticus]|uniref:HTH merR-type domain-containing protein n=1 Tax=Paenibacillus glycanilyticus TaxID=126569 RepID=A0ABQ6GEG1_9BACL|nr:MerR family transcriptional regulator [Paenibacillus glycanilyticus]GLX69361.1 hypothetical protein MU1_37060 [Paenibacillus glycanilyticus]